MRDTSNACTKVCSFISEKNFSICTNASCFCMGNVARRGGLRHTIVYKCVRSDQNHRECVGIEPRVSISAQAGPSICTSVPYVHALCAGGLSLSRSRPLALSLPLSRFRCDAFTLCDMRTSTSASGMFNSAAMEGILMRVYLYPHSHVDVSKDHAQQQVSLPVCMGMEGVEPGAMYCSEPSPQAADQASCKSLTV